MRILLEHERACLFHGDSADLGDWLPENSVDAIMSDPPAGVAYMSRGWDSDRGGFDHWTQWLARVLAPSVRALKPGGWCVLWALPRTSHWTARALELAGLEIRDVHHHIFGSGMPKSLDLAREIDMHLCTLPGRHLDKNASAQPRADDHFCPPHPRREESHGARTALRPAVEHWIFARKPLAGTYVENLFAHGTGGLYIEECRVGDRDTRGPTGRRPDNGWGMGAGVEAGSANGGWPAHVSFEHAPDCEADGCADACPVQALDQQSGVRKGGRGASQFFTTFRFAAKPARKEKDAGLAHLPETTGGKATGRAEGSIGTKNPRAGAGRTGGARNSHETVKPTALMSWLLTLVARPGATILDPFAGSGTTGVAALGLGMSFIGCEEGGEKQRYLPIYVGRVRHALGLGPDLTIAQPEPAASDVASAEQDDGPDALE
jgi:hypothetical protein